MFTRLTIMVAFTLSMVVVLQPVRAAKTGDADRPGTVAHSTTLADGSAVALDTVVVDKIRAKAETPYLVVREFYRSKDRIIVVTPPSPLLRLGQTVDVAGTLSTLPNGNRVITDPTVTGYTDKTGKLLRSAVPKGLLKPAPWEWKTDLTVRSKSVSAPITSTSPEPNTTPLPGPTRYATIHDALSQVRVMANGDFIRMAEFVSKPVASVGSGYFMLGEDSSSDTLKVYYQGAVSTSQRVCFVVGQLREENGGQVLCVDSGPGYDPQVGEGGLTLAQSGTIAWIKTLPDGQAVTLGTTTTGKIVTCALSSGCLYIEEDDRSGGIRVEKTNHGRLAGDRAYVEGTLGTKTTGERYISATTVSHAGDGLLSPLAMNNRCVGGGDFFYESSTGKGQRGITGSYGLNNIGLLIRTWGKVTAKDSATPITWFDIDDGSGINIKVDLQTSTGTVIASSVAIGDYVYVTGISSCDIAGTSLVSVVRPGPVVQPTFSPSGGVHCSCLGVGAKTAMLGETIRYTMSGSDPTGSSPVYDPAGVVVVNPDPAKTLKARVYRDAWVTPGAVGSAYYCKDSTCDPGSPIVHTCWDYSDVQAPEIGGLRLDEIAPGMMHLDWSNAVYGGFDVQRDALSPVQVSQSEYADSFSFVIGTTYTYQVRSRAYTGSTPGLPRHGSAEDTAQTHVIQGVSRWSAGQWKEISVTPQKLAVSDNQAVDSRTDTRYVEDKLVDFQFGSRVYRGGLFVGNAGDPSKVGRSFLKFDLTSLPSQMGTNDRLWTGNLEAYYTRSFADEMSTDVGYQFVATDSWDGQSVAWSSAPVLDPTKAAEYVSATGTSPAWYHWDSAFPDFIQQLYGDQTLSCALASMHEGDPGWAYFAKQEFDANLAPHILYAYGKYEDGGSGIAPLFVAGISLASDSVTGGNTVRGTLILNGPAPAGGSDISVGSNSCIARISNPVHIAAGTVRAGFVISTAIVSSDTDVTVSAFDASATLHVLRVNP